ncbi:winged helix DNA-binding domain-containing protein [Dyadobacter sp. LJ53]|uniref:winged helix DNA-binding domain-containing protein n=1 Tax=Dyadobacter chenwenxiniae TaxID=2906456 RepID=UPI001F32C9BF|nr:winged helix DNA-binding domain-containing protein [Dyadobacter chenwenxiniae]MCF0053628.1 winged helix DNA-binding domain-containing protein [Dyadobacter chenwenxiniae]
MTTDEIILLRLYNQQISHNPSHSPEEIVAWMGAIQAQDYVGAKWSLGLRLPNGTEADIDEAIARKAIVRTWPMRGTLHFVAADDVRWMLKLLTPRIIAGSAGRNRQLELDDATFNKSHDLLIRAMEGGKQLMRSEVYGVLENAGIATTGQRGIHIINHLAQKQVLCLGVHNEKQATYVLLDEWVPHSKNLEGKEALAALALRYFNSHGPATLNDFVWWSGLKITDAREGLNSVASQLERIESENKVYWTGREHPEFNSLSSTFLLPGFDEYMLGYTDRSLILAPHYASKIVPGNNGMFMPTILVDGKVKGLWKRVIKKDTISIEMLPFEKITKARTKSLASEAKRYGKYLGKSVSLLA